MIEELRRFILVANSGSITQTAEKIFITQSALSQSMQRLEKELNTKLFIQKGKTLEITPDGASVRQLGTKILELWEKAKDTNLRQDIRPNYTIGAFDNAALQLGKYFQQAMKQDNFGLEVVIAASQKLLVQLQLGIIDIAICVVDKKTATNKNLILLKTFKEDLLPVSSKTFKEKLVDIPFILYNKDSFTRQYIDIIFIKKGIPPKIFAQSSSVTFMKELALLGCGVALLPKNSVHSELQQKTLIKQKLPLRWQRDYGIYISKQSSLKKDHPIIKDLIYSLK